MHKLVGAAAAGQARAILAFFAEMFGDDFEGLYLHGSAVAGGLRAQSDLDLLAVVARDVSAAERRQLLDALLRLSAHFPPRPGEGRPLELTVMTRPDLRPLADPPRAAFLYGEWLRAGFEAGAAPAPVASADLLLVLAQARQRALSLFGPAAAELLPAIAAADVRRAMRDALPALLADFSGDERNVLLTLARMWRTAVVGDFVGKEVAALWASERLEGPIAETLRAARAGYLGMAEDDWSGPRQAEAKAAADRLGAEVRARLAWSPSATARWRSPDRGA